MKKEYEPNNAIDYIFTHAEKYAKAKSERVYLQEFRKSLKSLIMMRHVEKPLAAQEREAYASEEYQQLLKGLAEAIQIEEQAHWELIAAQTRIDVWRTQQANNRFIEKATT